jgi:cardiolipin synthase A/B
VKTLGDRNAKALARLSSKALGGRNGRATGLRPPPAKYAWPAGLGAWLAARYASDSLRHRREQGHGYQLRGERIDPGEREFMRAAEALTAAPISDGNDVELLINGDRIFPAFLETVREARHTVNLLTYVYWRGDIASELASLLCRKAKEGVEVNVLLDWVGTVKMDSSLIDDMRDAGVCVTKFRPLRVYAVRRLNNRTHRKLLIADGRVGMIGGVGIAEEWEGDAQDPDHWRDTHVRVRGPVVRHLQGAFAENWLEATGDALVGDAYLPPLDPVEAGGPMQLVRSKAGVGDTNIEALYFLAIESARRSLDLTAAYFAPRPAFVEALCDAADRDVRVRVLVPGKHIDKEFVRIAGRRAYQQLMDCGVEVFEYCPTMLHAKTMVVDGVWSSVGSVNFDNRSFQLQDEATLCVQSERFAGLLGEQFEADLRVSERIDPARWQARPLHHRTAEWALASVRREL